jgi:hypothetical protein
MSTSLIHVRCDESGTWVVQTDDAGKPVSRHASETAAERAAIALAAARDDAEVAVRDRYERVHYIAPRYTRG